MSTSDPIDPNLNRAGKLVVRENAADSGVAVDSMVSTVLPANTPSEPEEQRTSATLPRIGRYQLLREIARGGMGVVYQAWDQQLDRPVALKVIRSGELARADEQERFRVEAQAAARLDHPGIVPIYEFGQEDQQYFLAMAFVDGETLWDRAKAAPFPPEDAARILSCVAEAVHHAHQQGIVHRDLKPQNILLTKAGQPKVTDFGLAKRQDQDGSLTRTGQILGTPSYMPPEQATGNLEQVGPGADIYSLGATLYGILAGRPPFQGATQLEVMRQVVEVEPTPLRRLRSTIPAALETICGKCLEKQVERRYSTAQALADDLQRFLTGQAIVARRQPRWQRVWRWCRARLWLLFLLGVLAVEGAVIVSRTFQSQKTLEVQSDLPTDAAPQVQTATKDADSPPSRERLATDTPRFLFDGRSLTGFQAISGMTSASFAAGIGPVFAMQDAVSSCVLVDDDADPLQRFRLTLVIHPHESQLFSLLFGRVGSVDTPAAHYDLVLSEKTCELTHQTANGRKNTVIAELKPIAWSGVTPHTVVIERQDQWWFVIVDDQKPIAVPVGAKEPQRNIMLRTHGPGPLWISRMEVANLLPSN